MKVVEEIFFSGIFGGETLSLAAAKAVLKKLRSEPIVEIIASRGQHLFKGVQGIISNTGLQNIVNITGHPAWSFLKFTGIAKFSELELKTSLFKKFFNVEYILWARTISVMLIQMMI